MNSAPLFVYCRVDSGKLLKVTFEWSTVVKPEPRSNFANKFRVSNSINSYCFYEANNNCV